MKTGMDVRIDDPSTLAGDLVVGSVAAMACYGTPAIVMDMGTATTVVVIDKDDCYRGGAILPGVKLSYAALASGTSLLPDISITPPKKVVATNTVDAMRSGAVFGTAATIDGIVDRMEEELGYPCKLIATGAEFNDVYLSFQEYFERLGSDPKRWGKPLAALLGAFKAQLGLGVAAIGGKDSMSGSFEDLDVPPTLVSFAVTTGRTVDVLPNVFALPGDEVVLLQPEVDENGLPTTGSLLELFDTVNGMIRSQDAVSVWTPGHGGVAEAVFKMGLGSGIRGAGPRLRRPRRRDSARRRERNARHSPRRRARFGRHLLPL